MAANQINGATQIASGTVTRSRHNTATSGSAVITKVIAGTNTSISSTGADAGTGDVTVNIPSPLTAGLTLIAGTSAIAPLKFTSGTSLTTAAAGALEYDGTAFYASMAASTRGVLSTAQWAVLSSAYTLTSQTAAQKLFNSSTNGAVTLPVGTYEFECEFSLTAMSATSGSFGFALGGAATFTQEWTAIADKSALAVAASPQMTFNTAANTTLATASIATTGVARVRGIIRVTVAGTVIPQVSLGVAAAAIVGVNSFFRIAQIGGSSVTTVGNWS